MAGAMRRMGIYLGLVEEDDARAYGRYDARQGEHPDYERRYGRYSGEDQYGDRYEGSRFEADQYGSDRYESDHHYDGDRYGDREYGDGGYGDDEAAPAEADAREPEALPTRRPARPLGLAPSPAAGGASRVSGLGGGAAAGLAVREPVAAPEPAPAPVLQPYRITTVTPRTYNEARVIGERYREGCPVIMNLTELDDADAKRLVDFAAGLIFGLRGSIERVTAKVFLLSPQNVDVTAEDKARIREGGFFNQS
jgi:cell division inhibitor SepF